MWPSPHATRAKAVEMGRDLRISAPVRWASARPSAQCRVGLLRSALSRGSAPAPERGNLVSRALSRHCGARSPRTRTWLRQSWREADPADGVRGVYRAGLVAFFGFMDTHATAWRATLEDSRFLADPRAMNALRAAQIDTVMTGLRHQETLSEVPDFMLEGFAQGVIGACERIAAWRISQPQCTAEIATELVMALTWSGLERIAATSLPTRQAVREAQPRGLTPPLSRADPRRSRARCRRGCRAQR